MLSDPIRPRGTGAQAVSSPLPNQVGRRACAGAAAAVTAPRGLCVLAATLLAAAPTHCVQLPSSWNAAPLLQCAAPADWLYRSCSALLSLQVDLVTLEPRLLGMGCKVVDFGCAASPDRQFSPADSEIQTRQYRSPEVGGWAGGSAAGRAGQAMPRVCRRWLAG